MKRIFGFSLDVTDVSTPQRREEIVQQTLNLIGPKLMKILENWPIPEGRAAEENQKREVLWRLLEAWLSKPDMRLGQFLDCMRTMDPKSELFYIEDYALVELAERFAGI